MSIFHSDERIQRGIFAEYLSYAIPEYCRFKFVVVEEKPRKINARAGIVMTGLGRASGEVKNEVVGI